MIPFRLVLWWQRLARGGFLPELSPAQVMEAQGGQIGALDRGQAPLPHRVEKTEEVHSGVVYILDPLVNWDSHLILMSTKIIPPFYEVNDGDKV